MFKPSTTLHLQEFSNGDWTQCPDDRRSISCVVVYLGVNLINWSLKKQASNSQLSNEVEYQAVANAFFNFIWINALLVEKQCHLHFVRMIWFDNMSTLALASNPILHAHTKQVELDLHFISDKVISHQLNVQHIPKSEQLAEAFTNLSILVNSYC